MNNIRVLCVENHVECLDALKDLLEAAGYEVVSATTGSEGVSMLAQQSFQGVLLEYDLPDATGATVRAEMKKIKPDVPVLLFSGVGSQTPLLLRFFDRYLRNADRPDWVFRNFEA